MNCFPIHSNNNNICAFPCRSILFLVILFLLPFYSAFSSEYYSIREYVKLYPKQQELMEKFSKRVMKKGEPLKITQAKPVKIAVIYPGEQASDYWLRSIVSFKARMDEIGLHYKIDEYFSKPHINLRIQEQQIRSALKTNPDYLVFTLDIKRHKRIIERIITKRKPKIILQNITTPLKIWEGKQPFLYVGFDHAEGSKLIADYFLKKFKRGSYSLLYFTRGYVSEMRGDSVINYLGKMRRFKLVSSYYTDGNRKKSGFAVDEIIKEYPDIKFIYACSTDVALGAIDSLVKRRKIGKIQINGWGGGSSELEAIERNLMDVTVMRMNDDNGVAMAEAISLDIMGAGKTVPVIYSGDFALIKKGITKKRLRELKRKAFRYSGTKRLGGK